MAGISIETSRKEIEIMRDGEKVGSIYFDASDQGILARLYAVCDQAKHIQLKKTDNAAELFEDYRRIETELRAAVDTAFGYPCCEIVFGAASCFATANGVSQLEQFLTGAISIIKETLEAEKNVTERNRKYSAKYNAQK